MPDAALISLPVPAVAGRFPQQLPVATAPGSDAASLREVSQGMEALFVRRLLEAADKVDFGGEDLFGSSGEQTFREMRNAEFAQVASTTGSLGLAAQIEAQLARHLPPGA